jgi:hypothetical protein
MMIYLLTMVISHSCVKSPEGISIKTKNITQLVGGFSPSEKNESQLG